jgi:hypothetical protein
MWSMFSTKYGIQGHRHADHVIKGNADDKLRGRFMSSCVSTLGSFSTTEDVVVLVGTTEPNSLPAPSFEIATARSGKLLNILGLQVNPSCLWLETIIHVGMM